ncbi:Ppx/GppA phosphatase [Kribbella flavida DSM 17836]|uniref:Ppx/GppA phosphatase n=1 Tax=Kribbella flavida (strain DSM 17836 / JCM 10339 / NBRC 14399) TaxID=479435 RepID=D2PPA3_KRIFD|nr:Ppx/GppA phosphatase family protein [Kribbella flavida]ADB34699.1 Ppx/GppA phosphatase [Kribbella flavida DSM 17836]
MSEQTSGSGSGSLEGITGARDEPTGSAEAMGRPGAFEPGSVLEPHDFPEPADGAVRVAAVDCGTNSIRLLVADVSDGQLTEVDRRMTIVRLGQGVDATGAFAPEALERVFAAAEDFATVIQAAGAARIRFVATSAARDVSNRDEFFAGIRDRVGVDPDIISGDEEAALSFRGATAGLAGLEIPGPYLVADIGGGSTEVVLGDASGVLGAESLDMGSVRMTERHFADDPATIEQMAAATKDVDDLLDATSVPLDQARSLIGVAGTVTTVAAVALKLTEYDPGKIHHARIAGDLLLDTTSWLMGSTRIQRTVVPAIHPGRVDVIGAGALILQRLYDRLTLTHDEVVVSEHDILDGVALALAEA